MKELSKKKYVTLITIMILVLGIIGIVNIGNIDLDKGKVKLKSASIEKLKSSVIESKGYEEITYPVLYELEKVEGIEERNVIIKGTLTKEENKYARFKEITSTNITSTVSENGREIEIKIEKVKLGRQNKINIKIEINGAINETKIKPEIEIKEESEKEYTKVNTEEIEVKTNSVTGLVQDEEGMSVSNLELSINKGNEEIRRTYTDENGRYVFSDVEEGKYIIKVEEENYELKEIKEVEVIGGITENIIVKKIKPYEIEVNKYISKIKLNNNGKEIEYEYGKLNKVNQTVKNLKNLSGEIEYKIEIKNTGEKSGEITKIEEEVTEGLKFSKEKNSEWEEKNGKIINRSLEGIKLKAGEEKEITLKLDIEKTDEARSYLQKVTAKGEVYQNVVYILDGKEYRKEKVLDGETIEEPKIVQENFKGWYTDKKYTNKYNFENSVTKDIILYGKIEESTKKYTVQYIDEGKIIKEEELEEGSIINAPEVTKEGYKFDGWYEGEEKYDVYEPITRNLILESKYEINKYKVRFINEDGSILQEEILDYGSTPTYKKETPTKKRTEEYTYEFDKWTPEITKVTSNQEYKATYKETKNKYTVTYINDGEEYHKETVEYGSVITEIQDPTKEGYTFTGWYTKDNEKVSYPITVTKNITLYSKYEVNSYKVSYYNEGKKYIDDQKINYGENALKPNTDPSKIGYTFKYWSLKENGEEYEFSTKITKDIDLYAVYEINKYTVTYINDGEEYHKETVEYGSVITSIQDPTKEGYTFIGWYTKDNEKVSYPITVTKNITLYSKYEINSYKVSYYNEGKKYIEDQQINYGENALKPNTDPSKIGYTFKYWSLKGNGEEYEFSTKITKDITLYAVYEINKYTVTYINEGIEYHKETVEYGSVITEIQDPTKEGYTFIGWYNENNEKVTHPITVTEDITLHSKYEINSYKVSYYNKGKKYIDDQQINYGENALKPNTDPSKIGYTFKYWSLKENGEEYEFSTKITKDITLYAVYEINKYTVTYINEGIEYHKETVEYGSVITEIQDPTKEGYAFIGWYNENNEKINHPITVTENITLHSKYEINTYTVSFYHNNEKYVEDQKVNYGESAVKPSIDPTKEDYNFSGWVIKGTNNKYDFTSKVTKDIELESSFTAKPTYTVTFKIENEVILTENVIEGHKVTSKEAPYKKGYLFDKWYSDEGLTIENNFDEKIMNNKTIYGKYNENKHTVTYINEGTTYYTEEVLDSFTAKGPNTNPEKEGYTFKYFSKDKKVAFDYNSEITEDITLYAVYEINKYTLTYINEESEYHKEELTYGSKHEKIEDPFKTGYTFIGWYNEKEEKVEYPITVTKDITLHSKYEINKYTVTYMNEGTKYIEDQQINYRENAVKPETNPSKKGYTFKYWSIKENGEEYNFNSEITENTTLYAVYEINKYTVTYINEESEYHKEELTYGSKHEKIEDPFKTGYTFIGWYNENEEKVEYPITVTKDITLHSKYEINKYTVTYMNEGTKYIEDQQINYRENAVKPETNPSKKGYTFKYWSIKENGEEYNFNSEITENTTLYAVYEINKYTVTYINEGSEYHKEELTYGSKHEKIEDPFKTGYTFIGWYNENEEKVEYPITVTKDITLHSKYEINKYTITYINEGTKYIDDQQINYKEKAVKPETNPSKIGYTFKYWSLKENGEEYNFNSEITENITLYAVYNINKYTVTFKNYDGSTLQEETLEYGTLPKYKGEAPTREKTKEYTYTFKGWDKEITEVTNNQEYIATYTETKNKYNVKFTNYDGSILQEETLEYGIVPVYKGEVPTREKTDEYTYTFKSWNKEITEVTDNEIYIAVYKEEKNKYTVIYMDGEREYTRKEVNYGETVSEEVISKDHNIYRGWTLDGNIYDFNTPVTKNITIKSSFELVESPVIESTPIEWTKENVKVTITSNHNDYSYMYKIDDGEYQNYNGEFTVDKNCTVIAKSIKENVESEVTTKEITNIDKVLPEIKEITEENITTKSFDIKVKGQDNESGLSEMRIYKNEELMVSYPYTERLNEEKEETYSLTGLEENTTYKIKVELIDKVGNINSSEEKEITTLKRVIVSRIIGRNNSLYESEEEYELFESLEEAITACGSNECTIEMVLDTKESVNVLEGQEIKLELNGKTVTGVRDYTIENSGELIIVDREDTEGGIINNTDTAIKNIENGILQIGENEEPLSVSTTKPNIVGTTYGIYTEEETSKLKFYDGKIEGNVAIQGNVDDTPYLYNSKITNEGHQVATLSILAEAEAKITGGKYYTKLSGAVSESKSGTYEESNKSILSTATSTTQYKFDYDELENTLTSNNTKIQSANAYSYIKLDLTNYTEKQELTITGILSTYGHYGYAIVTNSKTTPTYNQIDGRVLYMTASNSTVTETGKIILEPGKIYYLHIGYVKPSSYATYDNNTDTFKITNIALNDYKTVDLNINYETDLVTPGTYGFVYQDGKLVSNNANQYGTTANSYIKVDLTNYLEDQKIYIYAELSADSSNVGWVTVTDNASVPGSYQTNGRVIYLSGEVMSKEYEATLTAGKINYIHLGYSKYKNYVWNGQTDSFTITGIYSSINRSESKNPISKVPVLNQKVDTVQIVKDITLSSPIEINETKEMLLDLNGYTLTTTSNDYVIKNNGNLTIIDGKYQKDIEKNQKDYESEQAKYDEEYEKDSEGYNKAKIEYEKSVEEYNKKLEEYYSNHPNSEFSYTGDEQMYVVPENGSYQIELWGAAGNYGDTTPGKGAYTKGIINLTKGTKLYIYVGGFNGYNGGGGSSTNRSGGGATDIRLTDGTDFDSLKSRIMVAAGGGGHEHGAPGGTINGINGGHHSVVSDSYSGRGATQTSGGIANSNGGTVGSFGQGGNGTTYSDGHLGGSGGGGYYGGSGARWHAGGGSGSSFISGYEGCNAISEQSTADNIIHTGQSIHYSGLSFTDSEMIAGNSEMPTHDESGVMTGNDGNGYAKISMISSNNSETGKQIEKPTEPEMPEILKQTNVEMKKNNFTYTGNGQFNEYSDSLMFYVNNSGNKSVTYYNKKINVTSKTYAHVNLSLYQNYYSNSGLLGTAYIGFSKTNEANTDDFVSYVEKEITSYNGSATAEDIDIPIEESGEYYFKIVLYHNDKVSQYTVYSSIYSLIFDHKPILKKATLKEAVFTGTIESTTNSLIYNNLNANLTIKEAILNLNKSGSAIVNDGTVSTLSNVSINLNASGNGIYNGYYADIKDGGATINASAGSYGIYNLSKIDDGFNDYTFNLKYDSYHPSYGIYSTGKEINVKNITVNDGILYIAQDSKINFENSKIKSRLYSYRNENIKISDSAISVYDDIRMSNNSDLTFENSIVNGSINNDSNLYLKNSIVNGRITGGTNDASSNTVVIDNSNVAVSGSSYGGYMVDVSNVIIKGNSALNSTGYGSINANNVTIGEKDGNVNLDYPKINVKSPSSDFIGITTKKLSIYDGTITAGKNNSIKSGISDIEDDYEINITDSVDTSNNNFETVSLIKPTEAVAQIGEKTYTTLSSAIDNVKNGEIIQIVKNIFPVREFTIPEDKNFTLDLNSYTIRAFNDEYLFSNSGTININDTSESSTDSNGITTYKGRIIVESAGLMENSGNLILKSGTLTSDLSVTDYIKNTNIMNIDNINITVGNSSTNLIKNSGTLMINNGTFIANKAAGSIVLNDSNGEMTIKAGYYKLTGSDWKWKYLISNSGKANIYGGTIDIWADDTSSNPYNSGSYLYNAKGAIAKIENLKITSRPIYSIYNLGTVDVANSILTSRIINVETGIMNLTNTSVKNLSNSFREVTNSGSGEINIDGGEYNVPVNNSSTGTINIKSGTINNSVTNSSTGTINIGTKDGNVIKESPLISTTSTTISNVSGTFNFYDGTIKGSPAIYGSISEIEDNNDLIKEKEDNLEVVYLGREYIAQIKSTEEKYYTLQEAINAVAKDSDEIKLLRNVVTLPEAKSIVISEDKNIILDLNGFEINQNNSKYIENNGILNLKDSSESTTDSNDRTMYKGKFITTKENIIENKGTLIIDGGTFTSDLSINNPINNLGNLIINNIYISFGQKSTNIIRNSGTMTINNGSFMANSGAGDIVYNEKTGTLTINDGYYMLKGAEWTYKSIISNLGIAKIYGGNINTWADPRDYCHYFGSFLYNAAGAEATIENLNISSRPMNAINNNGDVNVKNSTLKGKITNSSTGNINLVDVIVNTTEWYNGITNSGTGTINIEGGQYNTAINNSSTGTINIKSGIFNNNISNTNNGIINNEDGTFNGIISNTNKGTINIKKGTFTKGVTSTGNGIINIGIKGDTNDSGELNVSIENPNITGDTYGLTITNGKVNFYDGIISGTTDSVSGTINEIEDGYEIISGTTEDGKKSKYLSRLPVAEVESTRDTYYTLQEAIDAVTKSEETIKLLRRYTTLNTLETTIIPEDKNIVLDLNGYTLEQNNENFLVNNGTLKITDSSEEKSGKLATYIDKLIENNNILTLENINISAERDITNVIVNNKTIKINNSNLSSNVDPSSNSSSALTTNFLINNGDIIVTRGNITGSYGKYNVEMIQNIGSLELIDVNFSLSNRNNYNYSENINGIKNAGILKISGGNYQISREGKYAPVLIRNANKLSISGAEFNISDNVLLVNTSKENIVIDSLSPIGTGTIISNYSESGELKLTNSNVTGTMSNNGTGTLTLENITTSSSVSNNSKGILNINNVTFSSTNNYYIPITTSQAGTTNINGAIIENGYIENGYSHTININDINSVYNSTYRGGAISNQNGTININGGTITSTVGNSITNTGTINIGSKDGNVSTEMPIITGKTYGVSNSDSGKVNFYDGIVSGETGAFYGTVNEVEPGYKIVTNKTDTLTSATLTLVGDDEKVAVLNGINFTSLQDAINSASDTNESIITLYKDVTFESNITVPANKNIKLYLNGYTLNKGSYDFTGEGKITVIDGTSTNALANIMESVKEVLNIEGIKKNIIIYEMDDGSTISSESTYKLYKDNEEVILEEDAIGIYSVGNSNDEIRSANSKIYINELPKGKYKLIGDNNKKVKFEIDESGKIIGNVKENTKETRKLVSTAVAELIIMIQTGIEKVNYIMIILTLLVTISSLLYTVKKVNAKES